MTVGSKKMAAPQTGTDARFFKDGGEWRDAPILKGETSSPPSPDVKNIMITGGAGFIASWVVSHFTLTYPDSYHIICFDKLDYCASLNNIRRLLQPDIKNFTFVHGDIVNEKDVVDCIARYQVDTIIHFAAQSHVDLSFGNSYRFTNTNVDGTHKMLEAAKELKIRRFIHVSTDEVYGETDEELGDVLEEVRLAPTNPYAASKAAAEMYVHAYWKSYKLPAVIVRMNNVYGPQQYAEKIIPKFTCLLNRQQKLVLQGDGTNCRRFLYAGDVADAFDVVLHKGATGQIYNVDSNDEITNLEVCKRLMTIFNLPCDTPEDFAKWVEHGQDRPFNDQRYRVNGSKLRALGWTQKTSFDDGLQVTVDWYKKFGEVWWGDIGPTLTPFPVIEGKSLVSEEHSAIANALAAKLKDEIRAEVGAQGYDMRAKLKAEVRAEVEAEMRGKSRSGRRSARSSRDPSPETKKWLKVLRVFH